ncbi:MAG: hypothetical protein ACR2HN_05310 [Tepidiformaceae bacterium]
MALLALDWMNYLRLPVTEETVASAASLAWRFGSRGFDSVHLATALAWQEELALPITVATFDRELWRAAAEAGLEVWPEGLA